MDRNSQSWPNHCHHHLIHCWWTFSYSSLPVHTPADLLFGPHEWAFVLYPILSLTLAAPPIGEQLVAAGAGAAVGSRDVHAFVDAKLPSLVQTVHLTLVHVWEETGDRWRRSGCKYIWVLFTSGDTCIKLIKRYATCCSLRAIEPWPKWTLISLLQDYVVCRRLAPQIPRVSGTWDLLQTAVAFVIWKCQKEGRHPRSQWCNCSSPWQMLLSEVPLMWKPASQLQCCSWFTWAQRGLRLKAGSFTTLHSGGAASPKPAEESETFKMTTPNKRNPEWC